jgi:hypothetical protein
MKRLAFLLTCLAFSLSSAFACTTVSGISIDGNGPVVQLQ